MAKDDPRDRIRQEQQEIASAEGLFQDEPAAQPKARDTSRGEVRIRARARPSRWPTVRAPSISLPPRRSWPPRPTAQAEDARPSRPSKTEQSADSPMLDPSALVEEVWSRTAEWGPTLLVVGAWVTFIVLFVYFGLGTEHIWTALLTLLVGGMVAVVLSYPILITLERPVRITPEQAVRDYYGALVAPPTPFSPDVVAAEHGRSDLDGVRVVRGFQGVLERSSGATCARAMPDR